MARTALERAAGRKAPSEAERRIAARVVVKARRALRQPIPLWLLTLAQKP
jgi:hypothetical protein